MQLHFPCNVNEDTFFRRGVIDTFIGIGVIGLQRQSCLKVDIDFCVDFFFSSRKWIIIAIDV